MGFCFFNDQTKTFTFYNVAMVGTAPQMQIVGQSTPLDVTVTDIFSGHFGGSAESGYDDLLLYDRVSGDLHLYSTTATGQVRLMNSQAGWRRGYTSVAVQVDPASAVTNVLFYDKTNGEISFHKPEGQGGLQLLVTRIDEKNRRLYYYYANMYGFCGPGYMGYGPVPSGTVGAEASQEEEQVTPGSFDDYSHIPAGRFCSAESR